MDFTVSLKSNLDFRKVIKKGRSKANKYLVMYVLKNGSYDADSHEFNENSSSEVPGLCSAEQKASILKRDSIIKKSYFYTAKHKGSINRLGITVSKKVGNSVVRHRVKRLIKESYRLNEKMFNSGLDIVVIARDNAKVACFSEMQSALLHVSKLSRCLK